jgi:hypothetical protein
VTGKSHSDDPPGGGVSRRELIGRIIKGSAFAVPVIASFDMASLGVSSAYANNANQYPNTPPSFSSANTATFTVGTAGYFTILTPGTPSITLTQTGTLPKGVQFTQDLYNYDEQNNAGGALSGTPDAGTAGSYPLKFTASNSYPPDATQAFTLLVTQGPVFTSADAVSFNQGEAASFTVTTSGFPGAVISASSLPPGLILTPNQGAGSAVLSGTPTFGGTYPLAFTAFNGVGAAIVQSFTITVVPSSVFTVSDVKTSSSTAFTCVVTVPGPGLVTATLSAPGKHGSRVTIATAKNTFSFPGTVELKTAPNKAGRTLATAKHRKSEVLWLVVTFTPTGGAAAVHTVKGLHLK